jgi:peptidoglycan/LPS O-acetylase OafA/YrhL
MPESTRAPRVRYRVFGTYRFLLALMVVIHHSLALAGGTLDWVRPYALAMVGVFDFFVLSGYVIAEACDTFYRGKPGRFLLNRMLRVDPPYYAAVAMSMALHLVLFSLLKGGQTPQDFPPGAFGLRNLAGNCLVLWIWFGMKKLGIAPAYYFILYAWSLIVEVKFYAAAALFSWLSLKVSDEHRRLVLPSGLLLLALLGIAALQWPSRILDDCQYFPYFVLGSCIYFVGRTGSKLALAGALGSTGLIYRHFFFYARGAQYHASAIWVLFVVMTLALVILSQVSSERRDLLRVDRFFGDLTYSLYLNSFVVIVYFLSLTGRPGMLSFVSCVTTSIVFAYLMTFTTEPFTKKLRDKVRGTPL